MDALFEQGELLFDGHVMSKEKRRPKSKKTAKKDTKPDAGVEPATLRLDQSPLLEGET
jgi:hypothetical protein